MWSSRVSLRQVGQVVWPILCINNSAEDSWLICVPGIFHVCFCYPGHAVRLWSCSMIRCACMSMMYSRSEIFYTCRKPRTRVLLIAGMFLRAGYSSVSAPSGDLYWHSFGRFLCPRASFSTKTVVTLYRTAVVVVVFRLSPRYVRMYLPPIVNVARIDRSFAYSYCLPVAPDSVLLNTLSATTAKAPEKDAISVHGSRPKSQSE